MLAMLCVFACAYCSNLLKGGAVMSPLILFIYKPTDSLSTLKPLRSQMRTAIRVLITTIQQALLCRAISPVC